MDRSINAPRILLHLIKATFVTFACPKLRERYAKQTLPNVDPNHMLPADVAFLQRLGVFAQFETAIRRERQLEGNAKAKAARVYKSRKPIVDVAAVRKLKEQGLGWTDIANRLGIGRASVYSALAA